MLSGGQTSIFFTTMHSPLDLPPTARAGSQFAPGLPSVAKGHYRERNTKRSLKRIKTRSLQRVASPQNEAFAGVW